MFKVDNMGNTLIVPENLTWETTFDEIAECQTDPELKEMMEEHIRQTTALFEELAHIEYNS